MPDEDGTRAVAASRADRRGASHRAIRALATLGVLRVWSDGSNPPIATPLQGLNRPNSGCRQSSPISSSLRSVGSSSLANGTAFSPSKPGTHSAPRGRAEHCGADVSHFGPSAPPNPDPVDPGPFPYGVFMGRGLPSPGADRPLWPVRSIGALSRSRNQQHRRPSTSETGDRRCVVPSARSRPQASRSRRTRTIRLGADIDLNSAGPEISGASQMQLGRSLHLTEVGFRAMMSACAAPQPSVGPFPP